MEYLRTAWPKFSKEIFQKKKILLLDFDGTLAPIASTPDHVVVSQKNLQCLRALSRSKKYRICIISGRSLKDLKSFFRLNGVIYVGNHGVEVSGHSIGASLHLKKAGQVAHKMGLVRQMLQNAFLHWPRVLIEDKTYAVTVHYRNLPKERLLAFRGILKFYQEKFSRYPLLWKKGKMVCEIRPQFSWNKGDVARFLTRKFRSFFPIAVGDDLTDEDMFKALRRRGVSIRVRHSKKSVADYYLKSSHDVGKFLEKLCRL